MKNAKRKHIMVPVYGFEGQEVWVRLTQLEGNIWYIPERTINQLLDDYITVTFRRPDINTLTRLPDFIERVVVPLRDGTYYDLYVDPAIWLS